MESENKCSKLGFSTILWAVIAIILCAESCLWALTIPNDEVEYNIPGDFEPGPYETIWVEGTLNILPGAQIYLLYAIDTSVVNITGGTVVLWIDVAAGAEVTVYGTDFNLGEGEHYIDFGTVTGLYENTDEINLTFDCQPNATVTLAAPGGGPVEPIDVQIDIKPGSDPNPINPGSNGMIPVAILTTSEFDAAYVDPGTVTLAGAEVAVRGKSDKLMARLEDVDGDDDLDLILQVDTQSEGAVWEEGPVTLEGTTYVELGAEAIQGTDNVIIVPPE